MISQGGIATVDTLFYTLILLAMSAIFGGNAALELMQRRRGGGAARGTAGRMQFAAGSTGPQRERGVVESVLFFESPIGYPDKSIVSLRPSGAREVRLIPFEGDLRNQLPTGHEVEVTYQSNGGSNRVLALSYK